MTFLARIAARASGAHNDGVAQLVPKDRGLSAMRAAAPAEEMPDEPMGGEEGLAHRLSLRRAPATAMRESRKDEDDNQDEKKAGQPARPIRRAAAEPAAEADEEKASRQMWRAAAEPPEPDEKNDSAPVARATPPRADAPPDDEQELPEQTRHERNPQQVLAKRAMRRDAPDSAGGGADAPAASGHALDRPDAGVDGFGIPEDWRPIGGESGLLQDGDVSEPGLPTAFSLDGNGRPSPPPFRGLPAFSGPAEQSGVVIEQIDVFVQEPAPPVPSRPRLSDPSCAIAARYLRRL